MDRRDFLKTVGAGSLGLAALPALHDLLARPASAHPGTSAFFLVAVSRANTFDGVAHTAVLSGAGEFTSSSVEGGGSLLHFDASRPAPVPVVAVGTWTAKRVVNYAPYGVAATFAAGILELEAEAAIQAPQPSVVPFKLKIVCNLGPANIVTGQPEGYWVAVPGTPFVKGDRGGPFVPVEPVAVGLTAFSPGVTEATAFERAWEQEFQRAHGTPPTPQDRADRLWSLEFSARNGRAPNEAEWVAHARELASWRAAF